MLIFARYITSRILPIIGGILVFIHFAQAQDAFSLTVDPDFSTDELFMDENPVTGILRIDNDKMMISGSFYTSVGIIGFKGIGRINNDGSATPWPTAGPTYASHLRMHDNGYIYASGLSINKIDMDGTPWHFLTGSTCGDYFKEYVSGENNNPYNVETAICLYIQDDQKILIGGTIATDTLQPSLFRNLCRLNADGTHDDTFPPVETMPNNPYVYVTRIHKDSQDRWYLSGNFEGINGHETNYIARLHPDFSVDESFTSNILTDFGFTFYHPQVVGIDSLDRVWISGTRILMEDNPTDSLQIIRLMPDATVDTTFKGKFLREDYNEEAFQIYNNPPMLSGVQRLQGTDYFLVYGAFSHYNDTVSNCITVIDDEGNIQHDYFQGARTKAYYYQSISGLKINNPSVHAVKQLEDGSILVGGEFSAFDDVDHFNMVKLKRGPVSTRDQDRLDNLLQVYPNPASDMVQVHMPETFQGTIHVYDNSGKKLSQSPLNNGRSNLDVGSLSPGLYIIQVITGAGMAVKKLVVW